MGGRDERVPALFATNNGYEFRLALLAAAVSLLINGAGRLSVDAALVARATAHTSAR